MTKISRLTPCIFQCLIQHATYSDIDLAHTTQWWLRCHFEVCLCLLQLAMFALPQHLLCSYLQQSFQSWESSNWKVLSVSAMGLSGFQSESACYVSLLFDHYFVSISALSAWIFVALMWHPLLCILILFVAMSKVTKALLEHHITKLIQQDCCFPTDSIYTVQGGWYLLPANYVLMSAGFQHDKINLSDFPTCLLWLQSTINILGPHHP